MERDFVKYKTVSGPPVTLDRYALTPQAHVLTVWLPFGAFTWNRAAAVLVEDEAGQIRRYPVVDVTRLAQQALIIGSLPVTVIGLVMTRKTRKETKK